MERTEQRKNSIELLNYHKARMSMSEQERIHFVLKENGNCEGCLEHMDRGSFIKRFFVLDIAGRVFEFHTDNPKKNNSSKVGSVDVSDITTVTGASLKIKKDNAFEVNTPFDKYVFAAKDERDMKIWMQALKKAATSPFDTQQQKNKKEDIQPQHNLTVANEAQRTDIIGGCVIKTPVSTMEKKRNYSNTAGKSGLRNLKEGYCWKQGAVMKNWKKRYFRLNAVKLSYYEDKDEPNPIRSITTNDIKGVKVLERFVNRSNVVEVHTPNRKFYMDPENLDEVMSWKEALENVVQTNCFYYPRTKSV